MFLLGVNLQEFAVLPCSCDKTLEFSYEINQRISAVSVCHGEDVEADGTVFKNY